MRSGHVYPHSIGKKGKGPHPVSHCGG